MSPILRRLLPAILALGGSSPLALGCSPSDETEQPETQCEAASERVGGLACVHRLDDSAAWQSVSVPLELVDQVRTTKYMVPARDDARLGPVLLNAQRFPMHYDFLIAAFPDLFAGLTTKQYLDLLFNAEKREYHVGELTEYRLSSGDARFGFTVAADPANPGTVTCREVQAVHAGLSPRIFGAELAVVPTDRRQRAWMTECGIPVLDPNANLAYEAYHRGVGFGTLRRYTAESFPAAVESGAFGWQDILALEEAPHDVERVISGAITGTRQASLSHLAVRSASRGTPNCYIKDAYDYLKDWDGKLVRVECAATTLMIREATVEEAQAFWQQLRPTPVTIPAPDYDWTEVVPLRELPTSTAPERAQGLARFGAKGKNLAWLTQNMPEAFTPTGFLIPMHFYRAFLQSGRWTVDLGQGPEELSFAEGIERLLDDDAFQTDARVRRARLLQLQEAMRDAPCDPALIDAIGESIAGVFQSDTAMVRFRSSSNAEDGAFFNGAGLYDSTSACLADERDADDMGPSRCDPAESKERGVCRALKKVWASLWNVKAYEERDWYGIDHRSSGMGILASGRIDQEGANMVAFSGNPVVKSDRRYLINAQVGEYEVVSPDPGDWPEQDLLTVKDGEVTKIDRVSVSSRSPNGAPVLTDDQLRTLGTELARLVGIYPLDTSAPADHEFLLDTEWKVRADGQLLVKQVRPYLK